MLRVFAISGFSSTGKTSLIEMLIKELEKRGYTVAVVKSSQDDIGPPAGTDTDRHLKASASPVILLGPNSTTIRYQRRLKSRDILSNFDSDIVLLEGFKSESIPRIFCIGKRGLNIKSIPDRTHAIVTWNKTDTQEAVQIPILYTRQIEEIADLVLEQSVEPTDIEF